MPNPLSPEPWLRGLVPDVDPVISHLLRASQHIREDAASALASLTVEQLWAKPVGMTSAGFHAKHLAGSTRRLCAYLAGRQLTGEELSEATSEAEGGQTPAELMASINVAFEVYEVLIDNLRPDEFGSLRAVGRHKLPVTAISLAIHIAEHGHRHTGQLISAAKLAAAPSHLPGGNVPGAPAE